jgi:hypothetical protein
MINKNCEECNIVFSYEPPKNYPDKRKYCDGCSKKRKEAYENRNLANMQPSKPGVPVSAVNDSVQKTIVENWNRRANSYEFGKAGNRFKLYWECVAELKAMIKELREAGFDVDLSDSMPDEHE